MNDDVENDKRLCRLRSWFQLSSSFSRFKERGVSFCNDLIGMNAAVGDVMFMSDVDMPQIYQKSCWTYHDVSNKI